MSSPRLALSAYLLLGAGLACNSDDLDFEAPGSTSTGEPGTTGTPTTGDGSSTGPMVTTTLETTGATSSSGGDETETPPEQTCRDVLMCVGECALTLDIECFQMCAEGLPADEAANAAQLGLCVGSSCFESGACSPDTLMDPKCLGCIFIGILSPNPPGCEEQAAACE